MLLKLSLLLSTIGIIACNVPFDTTKEVKYEENNQIHQRNYQHSEYLNSYTEVIYKYETNEVNSNDDLIVGNIYNFSFNEEMLNELGSNYILSFYIINGAFQIDNFDDSYLDESSTIYKIDSSNIVEFSNQDFCYIYSSLSDYYSFCVENGYYSSSNLIVLLKYFSTSSGISDLDFDYTHFSSTDYNEIESVIYHQPKTVIGVINEFCETYLFSEIPYINTMTFEVGGESINLMTWIVMAVGLVIGIGILIGIFYLCKWIMLLFAGIFKK